MVTMSNHGGETGGARNSVHRAASSDPPPGNPQNPPDGRQQWKLRARRDGRDVHPPQPTPQEQAEPTPAAPPSPSGGPDGPPTWPGGETETAEASFWDWGHADEPADPDGPGKGTAAEPRDAAPAAGPITAPIGSRPSWDPVVTPVAAARAEPRREGIGQRLGNLAHLSGDPRMRTWQWRVIIAVVVGAAFTALSWRLGLTLAVVTVIADTIYRSRKVTGQPGVRLTSAQRKTRSQLARLERAGYRSIHNGLIPDSEEQIDHLVVGPTGVYAIDSEAWDKRMPVRTRNARQLWHGPASKKERLEHAHWESERAAELLSRALGRPVTVRPAMAVYGPKIPWDVATIRDVDVFSGPRLRRYLRRRARQETVQMLGDSEIGRIYAAARAAFPDPSAG